MNTESIFHYFNEISKISRVSFEEKEIADYLVYKGEKMGLEVFRDKENNVIIKKPGNRQDSPIVVLQAHTDMVWDSKNENMLEKIPYQIHVEDGKMRTNGTTLGADDGIGVAMILALLENDKNEYPALEAVFTSNEEETMGGAMSVRKENVSGKYMINLDSEKEGVFTIEAAGGISSLCKLPLKKKHSVKNKTVKVMVTGCGGGHSGLEIGKKHENAISIMTRFLQTLPNDSYELNSLEGGSRSNAIPEWATAVINIDDDKLLEKEIFSFIENRQTEWWDEEKELSIKTEELEYNSIVYEDVCRERLLLLLENLPHGVRKRTEDFLCSSANLAMVRDNGNYISIELTLRSSYESWYQDEVKKIRRLLRHLGGEAVYKDEYPAWINKKDSQLIKIFLETYGDLYGEEAVCEKVHAGLECGIIMRNCPSIKETISIGPTILNAHTISETLDIESVKKVYALLEKALERINTSEKCLLTSNMKGVYNE
ncbi:dipeptidase D [Dethiosulfatibacter aminovorans DSM 17477]|uniref:Dipeptidase D n=1 Tax=Dethiosulfatibacter aminovorans DSM 17477 TaxID=1121476 RepID=A0A1M6A9P3_9FIRM|nr:beta-Ala-His dipeptidase [Dethiosulfatibacter aminovorans]SHI33244.1 dipeptidase D [Dethiosulfatibacter aminovorans DSM 17477]